MMLYTAWSPFFVSSVFCSSMLSRPAAHARVRKERGAALVTVRGEKGNVTFKKVPRVQVKREEQGRRWAQNLPAR